MSKASGLPASLELFLRFLRPKGSAYETQARNALLELCQLGEAEGKNFDHDTLAMHLELIRIWQDHQAAGKMAGVFQYGIEKDQNFSGDKLKEIADRARQLRQDVVRLQRTSFVFELSVIQRIPPGDLLHDRTGAALSTLGELPQLAAMLYPRRRGKTVQPARGPRTRMLRGTDYELWFISDYLEKTTGQPRDPLLCDILAPLKIPHCFDVGDKKGASAPDNLKKWRSDVKRRLAEAWANDKRPNS